MGQVSCSNAMGEPIWVKMDAERCILKDFSLNASASADEVSAEIGVKGEWDRMKIHAGFTRILARTNLQVQTDLAGRSSLYVTIISDTGVLIAKNFSKPTNCNIIVTKEGTVMDLQEGQFWLDVNGTWH